MKRINAPLMLGSAAAIAVLAIWFALLPGLVPVVHTFRGLGRLNYVLFLMFASSFVAGLQVYEYFKERRRRRLGNEPRPATTQSKVGAVNETVRCPECDSPMVKRIAKRGRGSGEFFFGCKDFPACRGTRSMADAIWHPRS